MLTAEVAQPEKNLGSNLPEVSYPFKKLNIWFEDFELKMPERSDSNQAVTALLVSGDSSNVNDSNRLYPYECRLRSLTYSAPLYATIARKFDNEPEEKVTLCLGEVPVMVRSNNCSLKDLSEEELTLKKEDSFEFGGYFIINGNERILRMLVMTKRNYPIAFQRPTFVNRGRLFSTYAV
jgi:DNA-directed RNA polymerase I subunit RPA2